MRNTVLEVGQIVNTHALSGEVKVVTWTDSPEDFEMLKYVYAGKKTDENKLFIDNIKYQNTNLIVKFKGISHIDCAQKLKGTILYVEREQLGEPQAGYYICDLIGINVITDDGLTIGKIVEVFPTGSNDVYVVRPQSGKDILIPVIPEVVLSVDIDTEIAKVHLIEGLVD